MWGITRLPYKEGSQCSLGKSVVAPRQDSIRPCRAHVWVLLHIHVCRVTLHETECCNTTNYLLYIRICFKILIGVHELHVYKCIPTFGSCNKYLLAIAGLLTLVTS